jgi:hypothetical protein
MRTNPRWAFCASFRLNSYKLAVSDRRGASRYGGPRSQFPEDGGTTLRLTVSGDISTLTNAYLVMTYKGGTDGTPHGS